MAVSPVSLVGRSIRRSRFCIARRRREAQKLELHRPASALVCTRGLPPDFGERPELDREQLVVELLPLVKRIALKIHQHLPAHVEVEDLRAAGALGLVDALRKFDPHKKVKIETYARHRIRGAILDSLRSLDGASRDLRRKSKKVAALYRSLEARLGRPADDTDMASELGISLADWYRTVRQLQPVGLDGAPIAGAAGATQAIEETLAAGDHDEPFIQCYRSEQRSLLKRALAGLSPRERAMLSLYYEHDMTMRQIAAKLEVHESRISQIHSMALARLRKRIDAVLRGRTPALMPQPTPATAGPH